MAKYNITAPDGTKYQVTAPDNATQDQVLAYAQSQHAAQPQAAGPWQKYAAQQNGPWQNYQAQQSGPSQTASQYSRDQISRAFYAAKAAGNEDDARQLIGYIQQHGMTLAPMNAQEQDAAFQKANAANVASMTPMQRFMAGAGKSVEDTGRGVGELVGLESPQQVAQARQVDQALVNSGAGKFGDYAGQAAQMYLGGLALRGILGAAGVSSRLAPYINSAVTSGALSGAQPVTQGQSRAVNAGVGTALGVVGQAVPGMLGGIANKLTPVMSQAKQAALDTAARYSIPLHLSQVANGRFTQALGAASRFLPFSGAAAADNAQRIAWNRALGSTIGQSADELTPAVLDAADATKGARYDALFGRNNIAMDDQALQSLADISQKAKMGLSPDNQKIINDQIDRYLNAAQNGSIPGPMYQSVRQDVLGDESGNPFVASRIRDVRHVMEDAANRSMGPQDAQELQDLNGLHKNIKTLRKALTQKAGADNTVTPANLWNLTQGRFGATPDMLNLAQLGQTVLKSPINDSGTAQRWLAYRMLGAGGLGAAGYLDPDHSKYWLGTAGLLAGGPTVGRLMNSDLAARTLPYLGANVFRGLSTAAQPLPYMLPAAYNTQ